MYLTRVEIQNIRSLSHLVWEIPTENAAGWHVILGDNGAGKSTFVRCAVLASVGVEEAAKLNHYVSNWLNIHSFKSDIASSKDSQIICNMTFDDKYDNYNYDPVQSPENEISVNLATDKTSGISYVGSSLSSFAVRKEGGGFNLTNPAFSASFGPFRRFSGGDTEDNDLFESNPVLRRHRTTFSERLALPDALKWLQQTQFKALEGDENAKQLIANVEAFVNQPDFLPHNTKLDKVTSAGVHFTDGNGANVAAEELSDGYRSVLSLTFELLRLLSLTYPTGPPLFETHENGTITVAPPGVVLIDEIDAHLHPTWQKRIGFWLRKHFPQMQWIVTTHSPLICQAAETGTIYKLPTPGTNETGQMLTEIDRDRLVYGDILDAYSTEAFGSGITRSQSSQEKLTRLGELNIKEIISGLTPEETKEQGKLRAMLPTSAAVPGESLPV